MYITEAKFRVRYSETDRMGVVYHGNYAQYFDIGRTEAMRQLGLSYRKMEEDGIIMPIVSISMKYYRSALYDDEITVKTIMKKLPGFKIDFEYEIHNQDNVLLTIGKTTLVFIDGNSQKPMKAPEFLMEKLKPFFE